MIRFIVKHDKRFNRLSSIANLLSLIPAGLYILGRIFILPAGDHWDVGWGLTIFQISNFCLMIHWNLISCAFMWGHLDGFKHGLDLSRCHVEEIAGRKIIVGPERK